MTDRTKVLTAERPSDDQFDRDFTAGCRAPDWGELSCTAGIEELHAEATRARAGESALLTALEAARAELDLLRSAHAQLEGQRDALERELGETRAYGAKVEGERDGALARRNDALASLSAMTLKRDALAYERDVVVAAGGEVAAELAEVDAALAPTRPPRPVDAPAPTLAEEVAEVIRRVEAAERSSIRDAARVAELEAKLAVAQEALPSGVRGHEQGRRIKELEGALATARERASAGSLGAVKAIADRVLGDAYASTPEQAPASPATPSLGAIRAVAFGEAAAVVRDHEALIIGQANAQFDALECLALVRQEILALAGKAPAPPRTDDAPERRIPKDGEVFAIGGRVWVVRLVPLGAKSKPYPTIAEIEQAMSRDPAPRTDDAALRERMIRLETVLRVGAELAAARADDAEPASHDLAGRMGGEWLLSWSRMLTAWSVGAMKLLGEVPPERPASGARPCSECHRSDLCQFLLGPSYRAEGPCDWDPSRFQPVDPADVDETPAAPQAGSPDRFCSTCAHVDLVALGVVYCAENDKSGPIPMRPTDSCPRWEANPRPLPAAPMVGPADVGAAPADPVQRVLEDVRAERARQDAKWGTDRIATLPDGTGRSGDATEAEARKIACDVARREGDITYRHVLEEEVAEALAETDPALLRAELVQVAAVAVKWIQGIDMRAASPAPSLFQTTAPPSLAKLATSAAPAAFTGTAPDLARQGDDQEKENDR